MRDPKVGLAGALGAVMLTGCASLGTGDGTILASRVDRLESRVTSLEQTTAVAWPVSQVTPAPSRGAQRSATTLSPTKRRIQQALKGAGYYNGPIDGKIGPNSQAAIKSFQRDHALKVDGVVGKRTWARLLNYLSQN